LRIKIFLDQDGVMVDFRKRYSELYGNICDNEEEFIKHWYEFIDNNRFLELEWTLNGKALVEALNNLSDLIDVTVLSSTGKREIPKEYQDKIENQKRLWLQMNNIAFPLQCVHTSELKPDHVAKAEYSIPNSLLIDDSKANIDAFVAAGGEGILYKDNVFEVVEHINQMVGKSFKFWNDAYTDGTSIHMVS